VNGSNKPFVAIVDDDVSVREATQSLMRAVGFTAETFASAEDFLQSTRLGETACLILDMQMPRMDGLRLHGHLLAAGYRIPTILITAYPDERSRARALEGGVVCYLPKPFSADALLDCIRSALERNKSGGTSP
jgi:FixJ family two-component response regulator